jgi:hypothetical protein
MIECQSQQQKSTRTDQSPEQKIGATEPICLTGMITRESAAAVDWMSAQLMHQTQTP